LNDFDNILESQSMSKSIS